MVAIMMWLQSGRVLMSEQADVSTLKRELKYRLASADYPRLKRSWTRGCIQCEGIEYNMRRINNERVTTVACGGIAKGMPGWSACRVGIKQAKEDRDGV